MLHIPCNRELEARNEIAVLFSPYVADRVAIVRDPEQLEGGADDVDQEAPPGFAVTSWSVGAAVRENARDLRWAAGDIIDAMVRNGEMADIFSHERPLFGGQVRIVCST
ncbi:MAG: hypothetical protein R3F54_02610 [Alphaproteobacteria bacterium]